MNLVKCNVPMLDKKMKAKYFNFVNNTFYSLMENEKGMWYFSVEGPNGGFNLIFSGPKRDDGDIKQFIEEFINSPDNIRQ